MNIATLQYILKVGISASILVLASELAKRNTVLAGILISLPITSILAIIWLYRDTHDVQAIATISWEILGLVIASLVFFVALPVLLKRQMPFYGALVLSIAATACAYWVMIQALKFLKSH